MDASKKEGYHPPKYNSLAQNTIPYTNTLKAFYKSEEVLQFIQLFKQAPLSYDQKDNLLPASIMSDQSNGLPYVDPYATIFRFYEDVHIHVPNALKDFEISYMTQDVIRADLHPGKTPMQELWTMLNDNIIWYQQVLGVDGLAIEKPYLLPDALLRQFIKTARANHKQFVMIAEDAHVANSNIWVQREYDAMTGNGAYIGDNMLNYSFHTFAYELAKNRCPIFAACESYDSRRVSSFHEGKTLANMRSVRNQFLPNSIPMMMNGIECYEIQPMQLSIFADPTSKYCLDHRDPRYGKQAYLDAYSFNYPANDGMALPCLLEQTNRIREEYLSAISNTNACIPIWFDSPKDYGIGFTYLLAHKAIMVICNTNIYSSTHLRIHTENVWRKLSFTPTSILQRFSTTDPYPHDIYFDPYQNIPLAFKAGEIKFIEWKS